ncbi:unnamed protein product [Cylindrotheca closterium]|uniref:Nitroreductase domain-containing protein n=1 Tax=Cylindrotheca closterium TaxID=2856 RepID=A0AAD2FRX5_9STRA|nr:unnamed protein product [Cylindrotheca closterium]
MPIAYFLLHFILVLQLSYAFQSYSIPSILKSQPSRSVSSYHSSSSVNLNSHSEQVHVGASSSSLDDAVLNRYACTRFKRFDNETGALEYASPSDPDIVNGAASALDLARRAPSGFNTQPYKVLLVSSKEQKEALSRYCCGHNAHRVRDSDCTAIFLADRQVTRTFGDFSDMLQKNNENRPPKGLWLMKVYITLFSSGLPFPKWIAGPISWAMRLALRMVSWVARSSYPIPTLSSSETWSQKNTMLVAMTYMLGCTTRQIATCPMEGFTTWGIRQALKIPRRYTIPLIVATGTPHYTRRRPSIDTQGKTSSSTKPTAEAANSSTVSSSGTMRTDDTGVSHGPSSSTSGTPRYSFDNVVFGDSFGQPYSQL